MYQVIWGLFDEPHTKPLDWVGEIRWISGVEGEGWIDLAEPICPCHCRPFRFSVHRSQYIRNRDPNKPRTREWHLDSSLTSNELRHESAAYIAHKDHLWRVEFTLRYGQMYIDQWTYLYENEEGGDDDSGSLRVPPGSVKVLKKRILVAVVPIAAKRRLAVLTHLGNVGSSKILFKNKGHTSVVLGGTVYSFEARGWTSHTPVRDYWAKVPEHQRVRIAVQEINVYFDHANVAAVEERLRYEWPWYVRLLYSLPVFTFLFSPYLLPSGVCSQKSASVMGIDPPNLDTPRNVFHTVCAELPVLRQYFISWPVEQMLRGRERMELTAKERGKVFEWLKRDLPPAPPNSILTWR